MHRILKYPPLVSLFFILLMILISLFIPFLSFQISILKWFATGFFISSLLIVLLAALAFKRVQTTIDPTTPDKTSSLVVSGIYAYSRNPMYLGILGSLIGISFLLSNLLSFLLLPLFIITMNRLFIEPEEKALMSIFDQSFSEYKQKVRRWV